VIVELPPGAVAVIFHSVRRADVDGYAAMSDADGYAAMAARMDALAAEQPGYLGVRSVRDVHTGEGITVSYWRDDGSARAWKAVAEHLEAQRRGRDEWYTEYVVVVAEVIRAYGSG
jgi:heme-degrading monooxygenase HmoA